MISTCTESVQQCPLHKDTGEQVRCSLKASFHGYHIASLLVGDFYVLCPEMIESGIIHIVLPPLYGLFPKKAKQSPIYLRSADELQIWMANNVYMRDYDIGVRVKNYADKTLYLQGQTCVNFLRLILVIGEAITNLSQELVVDPLVVEQLTYVTAEIDLHNKVVDVERIKAKLHFDEVNYDPIGQILILSTGRDDHIIPLQNVYERLVQVITPLLNRIQWKTTQIYLTSKHTKAFRDQRVSVMQLYTVLKKFDDEFTINRYKGLGEMSPLDLAETCLNPASRNSYQITSVGDVDTIFNLLGDDSAHRKKILRRD